MAYRSTGAGSVIRSTLTRLSASSKSDRRYARAREKRAEAEEGYRLHHRQLRTARQDLRTRETAVGSSEEKILADERAAKDRIATAVAAIPASERAHNEVRDRRVRAAEEEARLREELADQEAAVIETGRSLRGALGRPEIVNGAGLDPSSLPGQVLDDPASPARDRLRALRDQLAGGYDAQLDERDGIKVCRLLDDHGSHDVAVVGERIAAEAAEARGRLTERESDVFQRFLTGELGDHLSTQVITAANLVADLNDTLKTVRTSHGLGVELRWKLDESAVDTDADVRVAVELLRSPSSLRTREQSEQLRDVLQRRIEDARRADPSAGYTAHLRTALDYRAWFTFQT